MGGFMSSAKRRNINTKATTGNMRTISRWGMMVHRAKTRMKVSK